MVFLFPTAASAQTITSWKAGSGKWETATNWSGGVAPSTSYIVFVTNAATKTITIDFATTTNSPSAMTVSNLTVSAPLNSTNTLFLNNAGLATPLDILKGFTIGANGVLVASNSALRVDGLPFGGEFSVDGTVVLDSNSIITTNATTSIGKTSSGRATILAGTWLAGGVNVGGTNFSSQGTLTIAGGTNTLLSSLQLGFSSAGAVWMTGGRLTVTNGTTFVGDIGVGQMTISNGTWLAANVNVAVNAGSAGTLTVAGGTNAMLGPLNVGGVPGSTGTLWITGGQLVVTNTPASVGEDSRFIVDGSVMLTNGSSIIVSNIDTVIGNAGSGSLTVFGGSMLVSLLRVGNGAGSRGTVTASGGTITCLASFDGIELGKLAGSTGTFWLTGGRLVVTNNAATVVGDGGVGQMTVSNGTALLTSVYVGFNTGSSGTLTMAGGTNQLSSLLYLGRWSGATGAVWVTGGRLVVTNAEMAVGQDGVGQMTVSNGTALLRDVYVGFTTGSRGTLTVAGGTSAVSSSLVVGNDANATGAVTVAGGSLFVTNAAGTATLVVGQSGRGDYTQTGGTVTVDQLVVTNNPTDAVFQLNGGTLFTKASFYSNAVLNVGTAGNSATLNFQGATHSLTNALNLAPSAGSTGTVWMTANQLMVGSAAIGLNGVGRMTVSNGTWQVGGLVRVGAFAGSGGTLTMAGGTSSVFSNLTIGNFPCTPTGTVVVTGGNLFVTNATASAVLEVRTGSLILNSGLLTIDKFVMTNSCGSFNRTGGTLVYSSAVLDPAGDADGDGLPNGWEQSFGIDPLNSSGSNGAAGDPDGDGWSNLQEYNLGTNPNNSSSVPVNSWTNSASGKWETAANWSLGLAPASNQTLVVTNALTKTVTIDSVTSTNVATMTVSNLTVSAPLNSTNTLFVDSAFYPPLEVRSQLTLSNNSVVVNDASVVYVDGGLSVGGSGTGNRLVITNFGFLYGIGTVIGGVPGSNNSVVVTAGSEWDIYGSLNVRNSAPGIAIKVADGGFVWAVTNVFIGNSATADGNVVVVSDPDSYWENDGILNVGGSGHDAQFIVSNSASAFSSDVVIGDPVGHNHSAVVTGTGSIWQVTNTIQIGNGGTNDSLTITDAGSLAAAQVRVNGAVLILNGGTFSTASLVITNGGAVQYAQTYKVDNATVSIASGTAQASSNLVVASTAGSTGTVNVTGGQLVVTNGVLGIGNSGTVTSGGGVGSMTVSNGTVIASKIVLGSSIGGQGELLIQSGGLVSISGPAGSNCEVIANSVKLSGTGALDMGNGQFIIGSDHPGAMDMDDGLATCFDVTVGDNALGTCNVRGGLMTLSSKLDVGNIVGSGIGTGTVWITGGEWSCNSLSTIGNGGIGHMIVSNSTVRPLRMAIGNLSGGTLTLASGSLFSTNMIVGFDVNSTGTVWITGGELDVTNASATARLIIGRAGVGGGGQGTVVLSNGTLMVDQLLVTNSTKSLFSFVGGTLKTGHTLVTNDAEFVVGDGTSPATLDLLGGFHSFANGLKISHHATLAGSGTVSNSVVNSGVIYPDGGPLIFTGPVTNNRLIVTNSPNQFPGGLVNNDTVLDAAKDADGDGMNNLSEVLAGTDPLNSASVFRILAIAREGNNLRVTWSTVGGKRYVVQTSSGTSGNYANNFTDLTSSVISMPGTIESTTSYLDPGAATSTPARYYRVRLAP